MKNKFVYIGVFLIWTVFASAWYVCGIRSSCVLPILKLDFITTNEGAQRLLRAISPTKTPTPTPGIPSDFEVIFLPDQSVYSQADGVENKLKQLADYMVSHDEVRVTLTGHIANTGVPQTTAAAIFNNTLGKNRAEVVKNRLVQLGAAAESITTSAQTSQEPILENLTDAQRARNRRVDVSILLGSSQ